MTPDEHDWLHSFVADYAFAYAYEGSQDRVETMNAIFEWVENFGHEEFLRGVAFGKGCITKESNEEKIND